MNEYLWLLLGFALLIGGGDLLVRHAVNVATALNISPVFIGVILLGFGTSAPELVTSIQAAQAGSPGIAVGNFVGSNISNVLLVFALTAALIPISITERTSRIEGLMVLATALIFTVAVQFWPLDRAFGGLLLLLLFLYMASAFYRAHRAAKTTSTIEETTVNSLSAAEEPEGHPTTTGNLFFSICFALLGLVAIIVGSDFLVTAAIAIAQKLGVSESVIGVSVVALGTSLPEMVTVFIAALKKRFDMAIAGILGSNIYNTLMIGGVTGLVAPAAVPIDIASYDVFVMLAASLAIAIIAYTGRRIYRLEALGMLSGYLLFIWSIWP